MNEPVDPATVTASNVIMQDHSGNNVPLTVSFNYDTNVLSIAPINPLRPGTSYNFVIGLGLKSMNGQSFGYPYHCKFTTMETPTLPDLDSPNPYVLRIEPTNGTNAVPVNAVMRVYFSGPMDPATLNSHTVHLGVYGTSTDLPATLTYSSSDNSLTVRPVNPLPGNSPIQLHLDAEHVFGAARNLNLQHRARVTVGSDAEPHQPTGTPPTQPNLH